MVVVYGNGTIHVDGDIRDTFEFEDATGVGQLMACSDGTLLRITKDDDRWLVRVVTPGRSVPNLLTDEILHSDWMELDGDIDWVTCGNRVAHLVA